jgi:UDPglucose 6-dehydrogenase
MYGASHSSLETPKKIGVLGTGYVGLTVGTCFAYFGHDVICADTDKDKIHFLAQGKSPIFEPGLEEMLKEVLEKKKLSFTSDPIKAIKESEVLFIAVGTPMSADGQADITAVEEVAKLIGQHLNGYKVICTKSTVPIGTGTIIKNIIDSYVKERCEFDVISNPEFLKEGCAIQDFLYPYRVVIGTKCEKAQQVMREVYEPLIKKGVPFQFTDVISAETIKYASNGFLAVKVAYVNEMADICERVGADIVEVTRGMGSDPRIGNQFLKPGPGFGGSCFPKDAQALLYKARLVKSNLKVLNAAVVSNEEQKVRICDKLVRLLGGTLAGKKIGILGLAFKADTDDIRESPAIDIIRYLQDKQAYIKAYDPLAMSNMKKMIPTIEYCQSLYKAVEGVDAVVVLTEWNEFKTMQLKLVKEFMKHPILLDARNILSTARLKELGFLYENVGNASVSHAV